MMETRNMYLLNELLFLSPLAVYVGWRIRSLIGRRLFKNLSTLLFLFIMMAYPAAESLSHRAEIGWTRYLILAGYYALPLLLYLVLVVVFSDSVIGVLRLSGVISKETVRRPGFRAVRLWCVLAAPVLVVTYGIWNHHHIRVTEYSIEIPRRSSPIETLRIAFAADFHLSAMTDPRFMEKFVAKVNTLNPDVILIGGDIMEGHRGDDTERFAAQFRRLRSKSGVFAVPGNHEGYDGGRQDFFNQAGIRLLRDEVVNVGGAFYLAGRLDGGHARNRKAIAELLKDTPEDLPVILMDHRPTDLENVSLTRVDIQLSGHTHNGQLFPVNFITRHIYELSWGHLIKRHTHFFVTSGVQLWGPPVRTAGVSEIMLINVAFRDVN
jgi:predicted MPP superfamily phosphohydrolase